MTQDLAILNIAPDQFARAAGGVLNFNNESVFAVQALMKTDFAMQMARKNPTSVQLAMLNLASTGLTLNPANAYAYLVPRDGGIVLEISYKGLIKIACDTGSIQWARAAIVYSADTFKYFGPAKEPEHVADPFAQDRGQVIGSYCIAKTIGGDILTEVLPMSEIEKIRGKSDLWAKQQKGPWKEWFDQMCKKAVVKRASKTWPYTEQRDKLEKAIEIANQGEGGYSFETDEEKTYRRKQEHDAALGRNYRNVDAIHIEIAEWEQDQDDKHVSTIREMWDEIPRDDQISLWLAPTKGGCFSTKERDFLKTKMARKPETEA